MAVNYFNNAMGVIDAGQKGWDNSQSMFDRATTNRAGGQLAAGNREGARQTFARGGLVDESRVLEADDRAIEQQNYTRERTAKADEMKAAEFRVEVLKGVGNTLLKIPEGQGRAPKLQEALQLFRHAGYPEDVIGKLATIGEGGLTTDAIRGIVGQAEAAYKQFMQTDNNVLGVTPEGRVDTLYRGEPKKDWKERTLSDGSTEFVDLNAGGPPPSSQPTPRPQRSMGDPDAIVAPFLSSGARVTSGVRTPERNAAVGGVKNSYHLQSNGGSARDLVPPQGVGMAQFHQQVREGLPPGWQAINEGDHIHIEPGSYQVAQAGGQTPRPGTIPGSAPKAKERWTDLPGGGQVNPATGEKKNVPNANGDRKFIADTRKEFNGRAEVKEYRDVSSSYRQIYTLANKPATAAGDISMVFSFMKMLDPGSVVREGEFATAQNAAGVPDQVRNLWNRALSGTRLNDKQRKDFLNQASSIYKSRQGRFNEIANEYRGYAVTAGENPDLIVTIPKSAPAATVGKSQTFNTSAGAVTVRAK